MGNVREKSTSTPAPGQKNRGVILAFLCIVLASATFICYWPVTTMPFVQ